MENHHFQWENPLFQWPFSIAILTLPEGRAALKNCAMARHVQFGADAEHGSEGVAWDPIVDPLRNRNRDRFRINWVWVNTYRYIFSGMNIHLPAILGFTRYQGFDPSPTVSLPGRVV